MGYEEFPPAPELRDHVRCVWRFDAGASEGARPPERIVPDGRCELVLHYGDLFMESGEDGVEQVQSRALFAGQLSRPLWLRPTGRAGVIGVRFNPAGARSFLGCSLGEVTDRRVALQSLWPEEARALTAGIASAGTPARIEIAQRFVTERIARHAIPIDAPIARGAADIESHQGRCSVEEVMARSGLGRRQFERRFRDAVGLSPKRFANVLRLRSVFDVLQANPRADWTEAALAAGYFDQSHLIRDFRRFVGCTPAQFVAAQTALATALVA
jgi:AraC-like DNA-binding protein